MPGIMAVRSSQAPAMSLRVSRSNCGSTLAWPTTSMMCWPGGNPRNPRRRAAPGGWPRLAGRPGLGDELAGIAQQLRQHSRVADDRHEVRIAAPARDNVLV